MPPRARLALTPLEDRTVPAGFGNAWIDTNLTVSFVPDGTDVAGAPSALYSTLGAQMTTAEWQGVVRSVFQEWITPTNLNAAFVSDDGRALGAPGPVQGSPHVGDIRISARPLSENVLAITNPFDLVSPWAGEIILNSTKVFSTNNAAGTADLRTVLLHEVGHALGVDHSDDADSAMSHYRSGGGFSLDDCDVAAIQALYGVRAADAFEGRRGNNSIGSATALGYATSSERTEAVADLTTATDVDFYTATVPSDAADPTVVIRTAGLSQTQVKVTVYGDTKLATVLGTATAPDANGNYVLRLTDVEPKSPVYIRVEAAPGAGAFAIGGYAVSVGNGAVLAAPPDPAPWLATPSGKVADVGDGANNSLRMATPLGQSRGGTDARWDYVGVLNFDTPLDVDHYQFIPQKGAGDTLLVSVDTPAGGVAPDVAVLNADGAPLPTTVLLRTATTVIVQVEGVPANKSLLVRVRAADPSNWAGAQPYRLGIDLRAEPVTLGPVASGTLTAAQPQLARTLEVTRSQGFRFQLSAAGADGAGARFTVLDANGQAVFSVAAASGQTVVGDVLLAPGTYTIVIVGGTKDGSPPTALQVSAAYMTLTDPIGPALVDEYTAPTVSATDATKTTSTTATTTTTDGYYWLAPATVGFGFLAPTDLYSFVWW